MKNDFQEIKELINELIEISSKQLNNLNKEVEKIITTGTFDEKEELDEYSRKMLRHTKNTEDVTKSANLCYQQYCDAHKPNIPKYEDFIAGFGMAYLKYKNT